MWRRPSWPQRHRLIIACVLALLLIALASGMQVWSRAQPLASRPPAPPATVVSVGATRLTVNDWRRQLQEQTQARLLPSLPAAGTLEGQEIRRAALRELALDAAYREAAHRAGVATHKPDAAAWWVRRAYANCCLGSPSQWQTYLHLRQMTPWLLARSGERYGIADAVADAAGQQAERAATTSAQIARTYSEASGRGLVTLRPWVKADIYSSRLRGQRGKLFLQDLARKLRSPLATAELQHRLQLSSDMGLTFTKERIEPNSVNTYPAVLVRGALSNAGDPVVSCSSTVCLLAVPHVQGAPAPTLLRFSEVELLLTSELGTAARSVAERAAHREILELEATELQVASAWKRWR